MKRWKLLSLCLLLIIGSVPAPIVFAAEEARPPVDPMVVTGYYHAVTLGSDGTVWTWGRNDAGQLGHGNQTSRMQPLKVNGLPPVRAVGSGVRHGMAVTEDGRVWIWGQNSEYELGNGTNDNSLSPQLMGDLYDIAAVSSGTGYHSLALTQDGMVWAWGRNGEGQLGTETEQPLRPVLVEGLTEVEAVAAGGYFSLALRRDGTVWSWGSNTQGELGGGGSEYWRTSPEPIAGLSRIKAIAAGGSHALALDEDGYVWAWGHGRWGQLGLGGIASAKTPQRLPLAGIQAIAGGGYHSLALAEDGTVWSWGLNNYGQLGDGTKEQRNSPVKIEGLDKVSAIAAGGFHSFALREDSIVWGWGTNSGGELGDKTTTSRLVPSMTAAVMDISAPAIDNAELDLAYGGGTEMHLAWNKANDNFTPQNELQYRVYYSDRANIGTVQLAEANGTPAGPFEADIDQYAVPDLQEGQIYYWNVVVMDNVGLKAAYTMKEAAVSDPDETASPSPSPTATSTPDPSVTPSPTSTSTPGPSVTPSPTATSTPDPSVTPSPTATSTPDPSVTPSPTSTSTPGPSVTPSPTSTSTPGPSVTPSPTETSTPDPSVTPSPTSTSTPGPSAGPGHCPDICGLASILPGVSVAPYVVGNGSGSFYPDRPITYDEWNTMAGRLFGEAPPASMPALAAGDDDGDGNGNGDAGRYMTRAQLAAIIAEWTAYWCEAKSGKPSCLTVEGGTEAGFKDVPAGHADYAPIATAARLGLMNGYEDGSFRPDRRVTRAEAVAVLNRMTGREAKRPGPEDQAAFRDVGPSHWAYREIEAAAHEADRD